MGALSQEDAALIQFLKDAGVPAVVTATTNGTHTTNSYHGRQGTGAKGLAVDFGWNGDKRYDPHYMAIFKAFSVVEKQLAELIYTDASYSIDNGKRIGTQAGHTTHIHVAVNKGVFVKWPLATIVASSISAPSVPPKENDVPIATSVMDAVTTKSLGGAYRIQWDGGVLTSGDAQFFGSMGGKPNPFGFVSMAITPTGQGYWLLAEDGGIFSFGDAQFFGSYFSLPPENRLGGPRTFCSLEATNYGSEWGYRMFATDGGFFDFSLSRMPK
jgi:hypothetical protein